MTLRIHPRGAKEVRTAPVVELGHAMSALLLGELPEAPKGEAWFFGTPDDRSTARMDPSWDGRWWRVRPGGRGYRKSGITLR